MDNIREYIYVDNKAVNSLLAQFDGGLQTLTTKIQQQSKNVSTTALSTKSGSVEASGGVPAIAAGKVESTSSISNENAQSQDNMQQESNSTVYDDFAVEVLENYLGNNFTNVGEATPGDFVNFNSAFILYDFDSMNNGLEVDKIEAVISLSDSSITTEKIQKLRKQLQNNRPKLRKANTPDSRQLLANAEEELAAAEKELQESQTVKDNFKSIYAITNYVAQALPNCVIISTNEALMYCRKDAFRLSSAQLQMLQKSPRPLNILGIVESVSSDANYDKALIGTQLPPREIGAVTTYMTSIVLDNFGINQSPDSLKIRPIALYF